MDKHTARRHTLAQDLYRRPSSEHPVCRAGQLLPCSGAKKGSTLHPELRSAPSIVLTSQVLVGALGGAMHLGCKFANCSNDDLKVLLKIPKSEDCKSPRYGDSTCAAKDDEVCGVRATQFLGDEVGLQPGASAEKFPCPNQAYAQAV